MALVEHLDMPGYWIGIVHPTIMRDICEQAARHAWYHKRHVERWERRYGKPYPEPIMEVGVFRGMAFSE